MLVLAAAETAYAQPPPPPPASPPPVSGGAYPPCIKVPNDSDREAAKGLHQAAKQYFAKGQYERAIQSWMDAYNFDCTKHQVFINIGNAYEKMPGMTEKAIEAFETYIVRATNDPRPDGSHGPEPEIVEKVANLKDLLRKPPPPPPPPPIGPPHDNVDIVVPATPEKPTGGPGPWPWVLTGSGGGIAVIGAILLGVGVPKVSSASAACPDRSKCTDEDAKTKGNTGLALERAGGALIGIGVAAAAGGVIWYFVAPKGAPTTPGTAPAQPKPATTLRIVPGPGLVGLGAELAF